MSKNNRLDPKDVRAGMTVYRFRHPLFVVSRTRLKDAYHFLVQTQDRVGLMNIFVPMRRFGDPVRLSDLYPTANKALHGKRLRFTEGAAFAERDFKNIWTKE